MRKVFTLYVVEGDDMEPVEGGKYRYRTYRAANRIAAVLNLQSDGHRYYIVNEENEEA